MEVCAYTIVSRAYLAHARVLACSFYKCHPDGRFWALLIDDIDGEIDENQQPFAVLRLSDLDIDLAEIHRMAMLFGSRLIAAIKPWVTETLLRSGCESVIYIDSDFMIYDSLEEVAEKASRHGVVVVPHVIAPVPRDGFQPDETTILGVGTFNAGFFAIGASGQPLVEFLKERLRRECHTDVPGMRVNEQRWLDFVPPLFDHVVLRDPGIDAAPWNIHERFLTAQDDRTFVAGVPLRAFHFSGFDPRLPTVMSARDYWDRPRVPMADQPALVDLCADYSRALFAEGFDEVHRTPFAFDFLADGAPIYTSLRTIYSRALLKAERTGEVEPPDPFDSAHADRFGAWARAAYASVDEQMPEVLGAAGTSQGQVEDLLGRMTTGLAGCRSPSGTVHIAPQRPGLVVHGPNALMDAGRYQVTVEVWLAEAASDGEHDANLLSVEVLLDGFVVGHASINRRGSRSASIDFEIPRSMQEIALSAGVQIQVHSRLEQVGVINAVLIRRLGPVATDSPNVVVSDWLPAMEAGDAERVGSRIVKRPGTLGFMAVGPHWRLGAGHYQADLALRSQSSSGENPSDVLALVEAVIHGYVLAYRPINREDLERGQTKLEFDIAGRWAKHRYVRVELRVRAQAGVDAVLESLSVHRLGDSGVGPQSHEDDWIPALWVHDVAKRVGSEIHSIGPRSGIMAYGPRWRLEPGGYRFQVDVEARRSVDAIQVPTVLATIQVLSDETVVAESEVSTRPVEGHRDGLHSIEFQVAARREPPPLLELTPLIELRITTEGKQPIRVRSAKLSRIEKSR